MEITGKNILPFQFYTYKQPFTGSCEGMRYRIVRIEEQPEILEDEKTEKEKIENEKVNNEKAENEKVEKEKAEVKPVPYFLVSVWAEPNAYEHTPPEEIENRKFSFDEEGYQQVLAWLNEKKGDYE